MAKARKSLEGDEFVQTKRSPEVKDIEKFWRRWRYSDGGVRRISRGKGYCISEARTNGVTTWGNVYSYTSC